MEQLFQDLRFGSRILWKSPGLSATAIILIALVIGGNTTVFSMIHAFITRPAPGITADGLVSLGIQGQPGEVLHPVTEYLNYEKQAKTVHPLSGISPERFTLTVDRGSYGFLGAAVTPDYFQTLGVPIILGRSFTEAENHLDNADLVTVISDELWQDQFQRSSAALGQRISLNGYPATIIGIAGPAFHGAFLGNPEDVWVPLLTYSAFKARTQLSVNRPPQPPAVAIIGRLTSGKNLKQAQAEFATLSSNQQDRIAQQQQRIVAVIPYSAMAFGGAIGLRRALPVFSVVTLITLIIVCANVANLMLGRAVVRQRETSVRQALGASRIRILRMLFVEGLAVSLPAWAVACIVSFWTTKLVRQFLPAGINPLTGIRSTQASMDLTPDWQVLVYAMVLASIGTIAFSIAPAFHLWRQELSPGLKTGEHGIARGPSMVARVLVLAQLAFSVVLLTSAGLAYRSFTTAGGLDLRFNKNNLLLATVNPTLSIPAREGNLALLEKLHERLRAIPGIESVSYVRMPPPRVWSRSPVWTSNSEQPVVARTNYIGPDYLRVLSVTLKAGREFTIGDRGPQNNRVIITENLANKLWPQELAIGQTLVVGRERRPMEVIGVASNAFFSGAGDETSTDFVFFAEQQDQTRRTGGDSVFESGETTFLLRYAGSLNSVAPLIGPAVKEVDARIPLTYIRTMDTQLAGSTMALRAITTLLALFSSISLIIASIGQYAVMAFDMRRRTRELGVRMAIGASGRQITIAVMKEGLILTAAGLVVGFALSATAGFAFRAFLAGVTPTDLRTYLGVFTVLAIASLLACYLPARRASQIDPLVVLRYE